MIIFFEIIEYILLKKSIICLKDVLIARDFFEAHLPEAFKIYYDFLSLEVSDTAYIEVANNAGLSDALYRVIRKDTKDCLCLLIEHMSQAGSLVPVQVLR